MDILKTATTSDLDALVEIEGASYAFPWSRSQFAAELANTASTILLMIRDGQLAGYICCWFISGELQIQNLAIAPGYRRMGLGRQLLERTLQRYRPLGLESAWLEVRENNTAAIELYRQCGFQVQGQRKNYYQDGETALLMGQQWDR